MNSEGRLDLNVHRDRLDDTVDACMAGAAQDLRMPMKAPRPFSAWPTLAIKHLPVPEAPLKARRGPSAPAAASGARPFGFDSVEPRRPPASLGTDIFGEKMRPMLDPAKRTRKRIELEGSDLVSTKTSAIQPTPAYKVARLTTAQQTTPHFVGKQHLSNLKATRLHNHM